MRLFLLLFPAALGCLGQQSACVADGTVVNSVTGEPIPRARVFVMAARAGAVADNLGRWTITNLPCGRVTVSASKAGFLPGPVSDPVTGKEAPAHDIRVELIPQAVVTGKVLDEAGDPVPNARVSVQSSRVLEGRRAFAQSGGAATNDLGEYRIASLPAGRIVLCASAPLEAQPFEPTQSTILGESCYPGPVVDGAAAGAGSLSLPAGREARVDFNLTRVPAVSIRGKVAGMPEGGGPVVTLMKRGTINQSKTASMSRDGSFEIRGVPPGSWTLSVDYWENGRRLLARAPVDVGASDLEGVVVRLDAGVTVTGTVTGGPKQFSVGLRGTDPSASAGAAQWDKTHTSFTIADATPGTYTLTAGLPPPYYLKSAMLGGRDMSREAVPILQSTGPIEVVVGDDAGSVEGVVQDSEGNPAMGSVMVWREGKPPATVPTSPGGRFRINGIAPGDYRVFAWDDFQQVEYADADWMRRNGGSGLAVTVTAGRSADVQLVRATVPRH
jgi:hypothetical protein